MNKKFSVPFNGVNPDDYINMLNSYKENIDSVFVGINSLAMSCHNFVSENPLIIDTNGLIITNEIYEENCHQFLLKSYNRFKRLLTLNSLYNYSDNDFYNFCENILFPYCEQIKIDGLVVANYNFAKYIHKNMPNLELHTSCNCFQWNVRQMEIWQRDCGISVFNPPREIVRTPSKLKEIHDAGFKIKALINDACIYGCPQTIDHWTRNGQKDTFLNCLNYNNPLKGNWVLPRWLNYLDEYVDIYKISGRLARDINIIQNMLDSYINRKEVDNIFALLIGGCNNSVRKLKLKIPSMAIPDKLLTCECKECDKTCFVCRDLVNKYLKDEYKEY